MVINKIFYRFTNHDKFRHCQISGVSHLKSVLVHVGPQATPGPVPETLLEEHQGLPLAQNPQKDSPAILGPCVVNSQSENEGGSVRYVYR